MNQNDEKNRDIPKLCDTHILGNFREKRAQNFIIKKWKWKCFKSNKSLDQFHDIDLVAWNDEQLAFIQVKSLKMINKLMPSNKAITFAKQHQALLYYVFVGEENERIYIKRIEWE